jgi:SAM-dependent MidA family methyltransferase
VTTNSEALSSKLQQRIAATGPLTFHDWMAAALYDAEFGYYCVPSTQRWGRSGDYRTSPESSVLFGATFARYFVQLYEELGQPDRWTLLESGAGAGHFARSVLETFQQRFPTLVRTTRYVIDERSEDSRRLARERLHPFVVTFESLASLASLKVGIVFANELLDAFPVHRVVMHEGKLREFYVGLDSENKFAWSTGEPSTRRLLAYFEQAGVPLAEGQIAEVNLQLEGWLQLVAENLERGFLVLVDYGSDTADLFQSPNRRDGTLRTFQRHQLTTDLLAQPGGQDLTSTIDWSFVKSTAQKLGFQLREFERQDKFLLHAGILEELELRAFETPDEAARIQLRTEARSMILPGGMAESFQVLVLEK